MKPKIMARVHFLFVVGVALFFILSCHKGKIDVSSNNVKNEVKKPVSIGIIEGGSYLLRSALDDLFGDDKLVAYNTLSDSAKYDYWKTRLKEYIDSNFFSANLYQLTKIHQVFDSLKYEHYTDSTTGANFLANFLNDWEITYHDTLNGHFVRAFDLLSDPTSEFDSPDKYCEDCGGGGGGGILDDDEGTKCKCRLQYYSCFRYKLGGRLEIGTCHNGACVVRSWGCGLGGLQACNGKYCTW